MMKRLYENQDAFEAEITIFTESEGGRKSPPLNGIRWDMAYEVDEPQGKLYMVWPEFIDESGDAIDSGIPLKGTLKARMHILSEEMVDLHAKRISVGTIFFSMEGIKKVAKGVVTRVTGLADRN